MTNLTRFRLILVDLSGFMQKRTHLKQNVLFFKVIPFNCIAHPFCASFCAGLARARAHARSELYRFSMKAQLFRDINGRFLPNELGNPTFLFHLFK